MAAKETVRDASVVGRSIRFWREERRLRIKDVADQLGIAFSGVAEYERGQRRIPVDALIRIAEILDVDIVRFFEEPPAHHAGELEEAHR